MYAANTILRPSRYAYNSVPVYTIQNRTSYVLIVTVVSSHGECRDMTCDRNMVLLLRGLSAVELGICLYSASSLALAAAT